LERLGYLDRSTTAVHEPWHDLGVQTPEFGLYLLTINRITAGLYYSAVGLVIDVDCME
jgi:hypothetical protein